MFESTLHRLRIFQLVAEASSFGAASKQLNITQPSITAHIQALEQEIGHQLFIREPGKKAVLTEAGQILYRYASEIAAKTISLDQELKKLKTTPKMIRLAVQPNIANILLPPYLTQFSKTHPDIDIQMHTQTQDKIIDYILQGKSDLGLLTSFHPVEGVYSEALTSEHLEMFVGAGHELADRPNVSPEELEKYAFISGLKNTNYAKIIDYHLKKLGVSHYRVALQLEDYKTVIEIVKQGFGIAVLSAFSIQTELREGSLVRVKLETEPTRIEVRLVTKSQTEINDETRLFMVFLRRQMSGL